MKSKKVNVNIIKPPISSIIIMSIIYIFQILMVILIVFGIYIVFKCGIKADEINYLLKDGTYINADIININNNKNNGYKDLAIRYNVYNNEYSASLTIPSDYLIKGERIPILINSNQPEKPYINSLNTWNTLRTYGYIITIIAALMYLILVKIAIYIKQMYHQTSLEERLNKYSDLLDGRPEHSREN